MDVLLLESFDQDATLATVRQKDDALSSSLNQSNFYSFLVKITLADGRTQTTEILTTSVDISIQGKVTIPTELLILKNAGGGAEPF
ncbi:hypothetical protein TNCV_4657451 [Trichonephila clavipes]|nr:hypothetical protein TNCV_4657451 [Trichonephila clavipes]